MSLLCRFCLGLPLALMLALLPSAARAQGQTVRGPFTIHYSALPSTLITPEVARNSGITRSASRGLLTLAILRDSDGRSTAVTATINAASINSVGQRQSLRMREVREGEAIYYLGEPRIVDGESLDFEILITPLGASEAIELRFTQAFHN